MFEENEIIGFHEKLTEEVSRLQDGKQDFRCIHAVVHNTRLPKSGS